MLSAESPLVLRSFCLSKATKLSSRPLLTELERFLINISSPELPMSELTACVSSIIHLISPENDRGRKACLRHGIDKLQNGSIQKLRKNTNEYLASNEASKSLEF